MPSRVPHLQPAPPAPSTPRSKPPPLASLIRVASTAGHDEFFAHLHAALRREVGHCDLSVCQLDGAGAGFITRYSRADDGSDFDPIITAVDAFALLASSDAWRQGPNGRFVVPLRSEGRGIGYVALKTTRPLDDAAIEWVSGAAGVAALVVGAATSADEALARTEDIRLLLKTARALASERDLEHLFERFHELIKPIMDATSFFVALGSWETGQMTIPFGMDGDDRMAAGGSLPIEASLTGHVFREGRPIIVKTLADFDAYPSVIRGEGADTQSALVVPMRVENRTIGVISVQSLRPGAYTERERDLLAAIAEQAAIAVENSQHLSSSAQLARELTLLAEVSRALSKELSLRELCKTVCREARRVMDAPVFMVALRVDGTDTMRIEYCVQDETEFEFADYSLENSIAKRVIEQNEPIVLQTRSDLDRTPHRYLVQDDKSLRSVAMAPLRLGDKCIGVMTAQSYMDGAYDDSSIRLLTAIGEQMALAVQNAQLFREARNRADRDPLTNVYHHRYLKTRLEEELNRARGSTESIAVIMLDLDNFKLVNDTYGHLVGDEALRVVTAVLHKACRATDIIGRYGGDEFMIVLPDTAPDQAINVAERIEAELAAQQLRPGEGEAIPLHCSIGLATHPRDGATAADLIAKADAALYQSKRQGLPMSRLQRVGNTQLRLEGDFSAVSELLAALLARDPATRSHLEHVNRLASGFATALGLSAAERDTLLLASVLHDVGKIAIPDSVLRKPGKLSAEERALVRRHPVLGATLIEHIPGFADAAVAVRHHHERFDGQGYPYGLAGPAIPLSARIVTLLDAFSAMTIDRPYHKGRSVEDAVAELRRCAGTQFCPSMVEAFAAMMRG
ncbi:MAG TPA: diguanylate cyclase [Candidatus Eremiobacteraceae bacterium]